MRSCFAVSYWESCLPYWACQAGVWRAARCRAAGTPGPVPAAATPYAGARLGPGRAWCPPCGPASLGICGGPGQGVSR